MAYVFYKAINQINNDNKLVEAAAADTIGNTGCDKVLGDGIYAGALTQTGSGQDDGTYQHTAVGKGVIFTHNSPWDRSVIFSLSILFLRGAGAETILAPEA